MDGWMEYRRNAQNGSRDWGVRLQSLLSVLTVTRQGRLGPRMLPPVLADQLHDPIHTLYSVNVISPDTDQRHPPTSSSAEQSARGSSRRLVPPPTPEEFRAAIPHPNAYYCPKENGWVILNWRSSSVTPPLAQSFQKSQIHHHPLSDQTKRTRATDCLSDRENTVGGPSKKTHHFHKYSKAVDALKLTPPFHGSNEWDISEPTQRNRARTIGLVKQVESFIEEQEENTEDEGILLDLYMCCQCSFYCVASDIQPGVIPLDLWNEFVEEKKAYPPIEKTPATSLIDGLETLLMMLQDALWKSEYMKKSVPAVRAPPCDNKTVLGRNNRAKLLRAWVEIGAWMVHLKRTKDDPKEMSYTIEDELRILQLLLRNEQAYRRLLGQTGAKAQSSLDWLQQV
ncbi:ubiquitin-specific protease ubp2 [Paramarasmius palmivorus]|uniref:Ubiquitin-specific protease ubp2 n=1 Tax=Paramarasmius palmivorus TaxID=297713 RepID=A0AAW0DVE3_9AGAR